MLLQRSVWNPVHELARLQHDLSGLFAGASGAVHEFPPVNVWANENEATLSAELPGLAPENLEISVEGRTLTLRGERKGEALAEGQNWHRRERAHGTFTRTVNLPFRADANAVDATFANGVLTVRVPRAEEDKPKKIAVRAA